MAEADTADDGSLLKIEKLMMPFVRNAALWPVGFAVFGHASLLAAIAILVVYREGSAGAIATLAALTLGTLWLVVREVRRRGRPAGISSILLLTWAGAFVVAWAAERSGAF
jgi:hypothetical protein